MHSVQRLWILTCKYSVLAVVIQPIRSLLFGSERCALCAGQSPRDASKLLSAALAVLHTVDVVGIAGQPLGQIGRELLAVQARKRRATDRLYDLCAAMIIVTTRAAQKSKTVAPHPHLARSLRCRGRWR